MCPAAWASTTTPCSALRRRHGVSVAVYLREPSATAASATRSSPSTSARGSRHRALPGAVVPVRLVPPATAPALGVQPIGPERSRTLDLGVEQGIAGRHGRVRVAYFNNEFQDLVEFVSKNVLPQVGVPPEAAAATGFGAYVNSSSDARASRPPVRRRRAGKFSGSYMFLDAAVDEVLQRRCAEPAQPGVPGHPDRRVLAARRRTSVSPSGEFREPPPATRAGGRRSRSPDISSASGMAARS